MRFVDEVSLHLIAGHGGPGAVSYRREAHVPLGGPDGGKGGKGGDIYLESDPAIPTLLDLKSQRIFRAGNGSRGGGSRSAGKGGADLTLRVPVGTIVTDEKTGEVLLDITEPGVRVCIAKGGIGGRGNSSFVTATRRAPDFAQQGVAGEEIRVSLSLKVMADVGLVGLPNAGKSTLITRISASKAIVADYPFTTLTPNLGVVPSGLLGSYVVADIPGLVEGAHEGAGLGHQFLRHVERCTLLVHVVSVVGETEPLEALLAVENELHQYASELAGRPRILVANKLDLLPRKERETAMEGLRGWANERNIPFLPMSCITGEGVKSFQRKLEQAVAQFKAPRAFEPYDPMAS